MNYKVGARILFFVHYTRYVSTIFVHCHLVRKHYFWSVVFCMCELHNGQQTFACRYLSLTFVTNSKLMTYACYVHMMSLYRIISICFVYDEYVFSIRVLYTYVNINLERAPLWVYFQFTRCAHDIIPCIVRAFILTFL